MDTGPCFAAAHSVRGCRSLTARVVTLLYSTREIDLSRRNLPPEIQQAWMATVRLETGPLLGISWRRLTVGIGGIGRESALVVSRRIGGIARMEE